jgi:DNA modification methylase
LQRIEGMIQFALGDWLNYGEHAYGEKYAQAIEATEFKYQTLRVYAYVAANVPMLIRINNLLFSHHKEVAPLTEELQREYLQWAEDNAATVKELRVKIRQDALIVERDLLGNSQVKVIQGDMLEVLGELVLAFPLVIADPPYNVTGWEWDKIGDDDDFIAATRQWLGAIKGVLAPEYNLFWFCSPQYIVCIEKVFESLGLPIQSRIIWHRRNMAMGSDSTYKFIDTWEMIYHCGNRALNWDSTWDDSRFDVQTFAVPQTNFTDQKLHPTQKPLELITRLVRYGSYPGDLVLDPFAGSGTTGVACQQVGRDCLLVEMEDEYVEVINGRLRERPAPQARIEGKADSG